MFNVCEYRHYDEEKARRTIQKIESLLSRSNADRLQLFMAMKQADQANTDENYAY